MGTTNLLSDDQMIEWINNASYLELLTKWRKTTIPSRWFVGRVGDHFTRVFYAKKDATSEADRVAASKQVGW